MSAQPVHEEDPRDPQVLLQRLPEDVHATFLAEYEAAVEAARLPAGYRALQDLLQKWHLLATAYAKPDFDQRFEDIRDGVGEYVPMDEVFHRSAR